MFPSRFGSERIFFFFLLRGSHLFQMMLVCELEQTHKGLGSSVSFNEVQNTEVTDFI